MHVCGLANIPNQVHHVVCHRPFIFNVLLMGSGVFFDSLVGEVSTGKTGFVNRVLKKAVFENDLPAFFEGRNVPGAMGTIIRIREQGTAVNHVVN